MTQTIAVCTQRLCAYWYGTRYLSDSLLAIRLNRLAAQVRMLSIRKMSMNERELFSINTFQFRGKAFSSVILFAWRTKLAVYGRDFLDGRTYPGLRE